MQMIRQYAACASLAGALLAAGCGGESKIPTTVNTDDKQALEVEQKSAEDAEMQQRQANPQ